MNTRHAFGIGIGIALALGAGQTAAQSTARPITLVVPFAPGGHADILARHLANHFESDTGQKMIIEHRTGAAGYSGSSYVARAKPDGQTLLLTVGYLLHVQLFVKDLPMDLTSALAPVAVVGTTPMFLVVSSQVPVRNLPELIAYAKKNPNQLNFALTANSADTLIHGPRFLKAAGIDAAIIPYNSMSDMVTASLAGHAHMLWTTNGVVDAHLKSGKLVVLAARADERAEALPTVPTTKEGGVNFSVVGDPPYFGVYGPLGMSPETLAQLNQRIHATAMGSAMRESLLKVSTYAPKRAATPQELAAALAREAKDIREAAAQLGVKPQ